MKIIRCSLFTGRKNSMDIELTAAQLKRIKSPNRVVPISRIAPNLTEDEKCFLIFGATEEEWEHYFFNSNPWTSKRKRDSK